jgi:hypothetical protein
LTLALITNIRLLTWVSRSVRGLRLIRDQATWKLNCAHTGYRKDIRAPANHSDVLLVLPRTACQDVVAAQDAYARLIQNTVDLRGQQNYASPSTHLHLHLGSTSPGRAFRSLSHGHGCQQEPALAS